MGTEWRYAMSEAAVHERRIKADNPYVLRSLVEVRRELRKRNIRMTRSKIFRVEKKALKKIEAALRESIHEMAVC